MKIALCTKTKSRFIDGSYKKPGSTSLMYEQWIHCDSVLVSWLPNYIVPKLYKAFLNT